MKNDLRAARQRYNGFMQSDVLPLLGVSHDEADRLGFAAIARSIKDRECRRTYCRLAIILLEANLQEHQESRPSTIALMNVGDLRELREWHEVLFAWEHAVWDLARVAQGDA